MARLGELEVLITGGAGPSGEAIARRLMSEGAGVVLADHRHTAGQSLAADLGGRCRFVPLDVRDPQGWHDALGVVNEKAALRGVVNNAGVFWHGSLTEMPLDALGDVIATNLTGALLGMRAAAPILAANGGGAIVNVAPINSSEATGYAAAYTAAAAGLRSATKAAAIELGAAGIRVNTISPAVDDPSSNLKDDGKARVVTRGDVAAMVAFLLSDDSATCTGSDIVVDAGSSAASRLGQ